MRSRTATSPLYRIVHCRYCTNLAGLSKSKLSFICCTKCEQEENKDKWRSFAVLSVFLASAILFGPFSHGSKIHISPRLQKGKSHCENCHCIFFFGKITARLYGWPTVLFSTIFPYCRPWLQAIYVPVKLKLQHPPRANPGHLTVHRAREGGNLNVALEGWGI